MQDLFGFEAGEGLEAFDHASEDEAADDEKRDADDEEAPTGDAADVFVVEFLPISGGGIEVVEEVKGEAEIHHGREAKRAKEEERGSPEKPSEFGLLVVFLHLLIDTAVVKDGLVVNEGIEERGGGLVGEEEEGAENEGLDGLLDPEEERGVAAGLGVVGREKIDRNKTGEENVEDSDRGEGVELFVLNEVPDSVGEGNGNGEAHCDVGTEVPDLFAFLTAMAEDENREDDIDDDVSERIVLLLGSGWGR